MTVTEICDWLARFAPLNAAESWDNVGLLLGDPSASARRVMTCLTVTAGSVAEAVNRSADLVVSHHPLPFKPVDRVVEGPEAGGLLWRLASAGVALYSPHTAFDSAPRGINQRLAEGLGLSGLAPLMPSPEPPALGAGRVGQLPAPTAVEELASAAKQWLALDTVRLAANPGQPIQRVGVACGSGGSFLDAARAARCDALVTGEATFHTCLAAAANGVALVLLGHYGSERFAVEALAAELQAEFPDAEVWASSDEHDPLRTV